MNIPIKAWHLFSPILTILMMAHIVQGQNGSKWKSEFEAFAAQDSINPPQEGGILFTGSSSIRMWPELQKAFNDPLILNRGFGGSQYADLIENFSTVILKYKPRQLILYSGDNDIFLGKTASEVLQDFMTLHSMIQGAFPETKIKVFSIKPSPARWSKVSEIKRANKLLSEFIQTQPNLDFIDIFTPMIGADSLPRVELFLEDSLHMNQQGYDIWIQAIQSHLD